VEELYTYSRGQDLKVETNEKVKGKMENVSRFLLGIPRRGDRVCN
jgi:hypothetical protein